MSPRECDCPGPPCTCAPRPADTFGPTGGFTGGPGPVTNTTNYSDATAPYEAVLTAWEQSGDVTRMWLAREFRESLGGVA